MDLIAGLPNLKAAQSGPKYTIWRPDSVAKVKRLHNRTSRRQYRQYVKTGDIRQFNRSQKLFTNMTAFD